MEFPSSEEHLSNRELARIRTFERYLSHLDVLKGESPTFQRYRQILTDIRMRDKRKAEFGDVKDNPYYYSFDSPNGEIRLYPGQNVFLSPPPDRKEIPLTSRQTDVLELLFTDPNSTFAPRDYVSAGYLWAVEKEETIADIVKVHISNIRGLVGPNVIHTIRETGFTLSANVFHSLEN